MAEPGKQREQAWQASRRNREIPAREVDTETSWTKYSGATTAKNRWEDEETDGREAPNATNQTGQLKSR